jgi:hypothetical protein
MKFNDLPDGYIYPGQIIKVQVKEWLGVFDIRLQVFFYRQNNCFKSLKQVLSASETFVLHTIFSCLS